MLAAVGCLLLSLLSPPAWAAALSQKLDGDAAELFDWVADASDNAGLPFMIVDKQRAHLWVFNRFGQLLGDTPVLLGLARGDQTAPGVGSKKLAQIKPRERTTPAGRFIAEAGLNARGEDVVWVDYEAAVSIHRVLTTNRKQRRAQRLATPTPRDNRISFGCINVPKLFYETVVSPAVNGGNSVVYVLPESSPMHSVFSQLATAAAEARRSWMQ